MEKQKHLNNPTANTIIDEAHKWATERNVNTKEEDDEEDAVGKVSTDKEEEDNDKDFK